MSHNILSLLIAVIYLCSAASLVRAEMRLQGVFLASAACDATIRLNSYNPGDIRTEIGEPYVLNAKNKHDASHYLITIDGAPRSDRRWVPVACGSIHTSDNGVAAFENNSVTRRDGQSGIVFGTIENLLAVSWQPAFCQSNDAYNRDGSWKTECETMTANSLYAKQFSIHGLWPNDLDDLPRYPCYCHRARPTKCQGVFFDPPEVIDISDDIREQLWTKMPGIQSNFLHRHEWFKHGTCYEKFDVAGTSSDDVGSDADEYYRDTLHVLDQLNRSALAQLFADNLGNVLELKQIQEAMIASFGDGAEERIFVSCHNDRGEALIDEIFIGLGGRIEPDSDLAALIQGAPETKKHSTEQQCQSGRVFKVQ